MNHLQVISLTADQITVVEGRNPRLVLDNIEQLAESIEENGIRNPIKVVQTKTDQYELVDGHRRFAACQYLFDTKELIVTIPAIVVDHYKSEADILVEMMVSNDSEPFAPFEEGSLYTRLKNEFNLTTEQITQRVGKSNSHVSDKIALLRADPSVRQAVAENKITTSDATTIVRKSKGDTEKQRETIVRVEKEGRAAVIDQDLKKGRMPKTTWALADATFDSAWSAMMGFGKDEMTGHGFRAMARTMLAERLGVQDAVIEAQLVISVADSLGRAYNRTEFMEQRRDMMQRWADYLDSLRQGAHVIPFKAA